MNKTLRVLLFSQSINVLSDNLLVPVFALFIGKISVGIQLVGVLFAIQYISSSFFSLFMIKLKDKHNLDSQFLKVNFVLKGLAWLILAFSQNVSTMISVQIMLGLAAAIGAPAFNALVSEHLEQHKHISEWGYYMLATNLAVALGSILAGFILVSFGFTAIFLLMSVLEFTSLIIWVKRIQ